MSIDPKRVLISSVHLDPSNVRKHNAKNLDAITGSLKQFGQVEPLVVQKSTGKVIGGNGRLEALRAMGANEVDIVEVDLNDVQATALGIALNRTGELATWDYEGLAGLLESLNTEQFELNTLGFDPGDLGNLLNANWTPPSKQELPEGRREPRSIKFDEEQWGRFQLAALKMRKLSGEVLADARCVELLVIEYLQRVGEL